LEVESREELTQKVEDIQFVLKLNTITQLGNNYRAYPKNQQSMLKSHNKYVISEEPFRYCILHILKVTVGNHF
jgi:hypothetical protein